MGRERGWRVWEDLRKIRFELVKWIELAIDRRRWEVCDELLGSIKDGNFFSV
jgi:hypothetical protein